MRSRLALALLLGSSALALAQEAPVPDPARPRRMDCVIEQECLDGMGGKAERDGETLRLTLADGTRKAYVGDRTACAGEGSDDGEAAARPGGCVAYVLAAYLPAEGYYVVEYETRDRSGAKVVAVADGKEIDLATAPTFSPSGKRFVSVDADAERGYDVLIMGLSEVDGTWVEQTRYKAPGDGTQTWTLKGWQGDDRLEFRVDDPSVGKANVPAVLEWDGGGWLFKGPDMTPSPR